MATTISCGFPWLNDGATLNGLLARTVDVAALTLSTGTSSVVAARGGVLPAAGAEPLLVAASTGMQVAINPGYAVVPNVTSNLYGAYRMGLLSQGTITIATSDVTNPRIDLIVAQVIDNGDPTSVSQVAVLTGTPAPTPAPPSLTGLHVVVLAQIAVAANASSIVAGNITDKRAFTTPPGAPLIVTSQTQRDAITAPYDGMKVYRRDTGNEEIWKKASSSWVVVGSVTDSGWITFPYLNGFTGNSGSPAYRKIQVGPQPRVYLRGTVQNPGFLTFGLGGGQTIGQLPTGFRPTYDVFIAASTQFTNESACRAQINASNGQVTFQGIQTSIAWVSLDGISFEQGN